MPTSQTDPKISEFLHAVFRDLGASFIELRCIDSKGKPTQSYHQSVEQLRTAAQGAVRRGNQNVYFGVCPRSRKDGSKASVDSVGCLWVDVDGKGFGGGKVEALAAIRRFPLPPSFIVDSGGGYHLYWLLREAELIEGQRDIVRVERYLRGLADTLGADRSAAELARILRVPGTFNLKDRENPKPVTIVESNPDRRYNLQDFDDWADSAAAVSPRTDRPIKGRDWITRALADLKNGNRNVTLTQMAGRLNQDGHSEDDIIAMIGQRFADAGLTEQEIRGTVEGVCRRYRQPGCKKSSDEDDRVPVVVCLADVEPEVVRFLWHPYIPFGKLTFIDGDPGVGKSTLAIQAAACLSRGYSLPGADGKPTERTDAATSLFLIREDGLADTLRPRIDQADGDAQLIHCLRGATTVGSDAMRPHPITLKDVDILRKAIVQLMPSLVFVDPIQSFLGASTDMHRANQTRPLLDNLAEIAEEFGCAIVCIRHLAKSARDRAIYRGLGSIDLAASARSIMLAGEDPHNPSRRIIAHAKHNLSPKGVSQCYEIGPDGKFGWCGTSDLTADDLTAAPLIGDQKSAVDSAVAFLQEELADGPISSKVLMKSAREAGISKESLERAKGRSGVRSRRANKLGGQRGDGGWVWELRNNAVENLEQDT